MTTIGPLLSRSSLLGIEARAGIEAFAHHLCSALALPPVSVVWSPRTTTAAISSGGDMLLSDLGDAQRVTRSTLVRYAGFVLHELLHRKYTNFKARDRRPYVDRLHNALEDAWIERQAIRSGLTGNAEGLLHALIRQMVGEAMAQVQDWAAPGQLPFSLAIYARGYGVTVPTPTQVLPIWREASARLDACATSFDTLEVARWVFDQLQQQEQEEEQQEEGKPCEDGEPGEDGAPGEDGQPGQEGQQQAPGEEGGEEGQESGQDGPEGDGQGEGQGQGEGEGKGQSEGQGQGEPADAGPVSGAIRENSRATEVEPRLPSQDGAPGATYTSTEVLNNGAPSLLREPVWGQGVTVPPALRYQVRRLFENSAREWREGGFKSGTLHRASLPKVMTGQREVFARRVSEDGVDSAVVIMLDISNSMLPIPTYYVERDPAQAKGTRIDVAVGACLALMDTLAQARAETMVIGFGEEAHIIKPFSMPWRKATPTLQRVALQGDTNDYAACRFATEALMRHPAERKVLMVLTDGHGQIDPSRAQADAARALGITVIGIGIQKDASETWGDGATIQTVADLGSVAFAKLKAAA
jgi:hypothetical protein